MATRAEASFKLRGDIELVSKTMRNPQLIEDSERSRGALDVRIQETQNTPERHEYDIVVKSHPHTITGIDRSKIEESRTIVRWDLRTQTRRWEYRGSHGAKVKLSGEDRLVAVEGLTEIRFSTEIDVSVPVVGRVAEKKIRDGFSQSWPKYVAVVERHLAQAGAVADLPE